MGEAERQRIAGFRVVVSWPQSRFAPPPRPPASPRARLAGFIGVLLIVAGAAAVGVAVGAQDHAPQPSLSASGDIAPGARGRGPWLRRSLPVSVDIPAIGVHSGLLRLGVNPDGTIQVPSLFGRADEAAWYKYSVTPGQYGASVIEGHVDSRQGPAVFFRLGALRPGNRVEVRLADGVTAVFRVTGVRQYAIPRHRGTPVRQVAFPRQNHLRSVPLRRPAPDHVRRRIRLQHGPLHEFHRCFRVPRVITPGGPRRGRRLTAPRLTIGVAPWRDPGGQPGRARLRITGPGAAARG